MSSNLPFFAPTKVGHIEHLDCSIAADTRIECAIRTDARADHRPQMRSIMLHELDPFLLLLPELDVSINAGRDDEVGRMRRDVDSRERVSVHEGFVVP